ncbi:MAG: FHA domain-containing protein, partial [Planctomycetes bacterium]|nr:FHA domain-containing protein [Planctomycetota bacterium]
MLLTFLTGERRGETLEVSAGPATAGRDAGCQISIRDPKISRRHCQIYIEGGIWRVRDLGSANGTWLDGKRVQQERLAASSVLKIGDTVLEVSSVEVPAAAGEADEEQRDAARDEGDTATTPADPDAIIAAAGPAAAPRKLLAGAGAILLLGIVAAAIFLPDAWRSLFRRGDEDPRSSGGATLDELAAAGGQPQPSAASSRPAAAEDPRRLAPTSRPQEVADPDAQRQQQRQPEPEPQPDPQQQQPDPQPEAGAAGAAMKGSEPSRPPSGSSQPESPGLDAGRAVAVERMLEGGEFQRALRLLAAASDGSEGGSPEAHAGGAAAASGERREIAARILAAAEAELRSCEERGKALVAEGRYGEARELFLDLAGRLPRDFIEPAMDALSRLGDVERGRLDAEKARADGLLAGGGRFCEAMAFLEYEAAEQVLDDLERALVPE